MCVLRESQPLATPVPVHLSSVTESLGPVCLFGRGMAAVPSLEENRGDSRKLGGSAGAGVAAHRRPPANQGPQWTCLLNTVTAKPHCQRQNLPCI